MLRDNRRVDFKRFKFKNFAVGLWFFILSGVMLVMICREAPVTEFIAYCRGIEVPCTILAAEVRERHENGINREVAVRFRYEVSGKTYDGAWAGPVFKSRSATQEEIDATLAQHRPGAPATCHINPDTPSEARLRADFPWNEFGGAVFVSGFFLFGLYLMISSFGKLPEPNEWKSGERTGRVMGFVIGLLFAGIGYGMLWKTWENKLTRPDISTWVETPCVIESASVRKISGKRPSYEFEARYAYRVGNKVFHGFEIRPGMYEIRLSGKHDAVVSRYAPGAHATCFVDPGNKGRAVLEGPSDDTGGLVMGTVFFGVFAAIGTLLTVGCAFLPTDFGGKGFQKFSTLFFTGGVASVFVTAAIFVPTIRVQGTPTDSWIARMLFGLFAVVVAAVITRRIWRNIDEAPVIPAKATKSQRTKKRRR